MAGAEAAGRGRAGAGDVTAAPGPAVATCLPVGSDTDLTWVRQQIRQVAAGLGFGLVQLTKLVTAASELARNTLVYGGGGHVEITPLERGTIRGCGCPSSTAVPGSMTSSWP